METLNVDLGDRSYPIFIGSGLLSNPELITNYVNASSAVVVTNETIAPLYLEKVDGLIGDLRHSATVLPDGEQFKTLDTVNQIFTELLEGRFDRHTTLIALGGGVVGDMTGFAAAAYQRGINFIQVPTTLLSQVDSSVGGKTGVNHPLGKNMIGAFHQPQSVVIDIDTLDTLEDRELISGIAEVIKYGLIIDAEFFEWLEDNIEKLLARDKGALIYAIKRSCEIKAEVVAADEKEKGQRALLNLGHTFGHAIETAMGYGNWLHGEAVGCGMAMAARMSHKLGWMTDSELDRTISLITRAQLPITPPSEISTERFLELMSVDKKVIDGTLRLILLKGIGSSVVTSDFPAKVLQETLGNSDV